MTAFHFHEMLIDLNTFNFKLGCLILIYETIVELKLSRYSSNAPNFRKIIFLLMVRRLN